MTKRLGVTWSLILIAATVLLGVAVSGGPAANGIDQWWHGLMADIRSPGLLSFAEVLDEVGGDVIATLVVPLVIGLVLLLLRGWKASVFALATFALSAVLVQLLKSLINRVRPEDMLVVSDHGSFPSGHTANAATIAVALYLLFPRLAVAIVGGLWILLMAVSRTIVSAHWLTDTIGGAMLGAAVALLVATLLLNWATGQQQLMSQHEPDQTPPVDKEPLEHA